jgi:nucleoside-diphosphate kinase
MIEQTLLVLKPDAVMRRGVGALVLEKLLEALPDAQPRGFLEMAVPLSLAEKHYAIHEGKFFYPWLLKFIQVGKVLATVLEGDDIIGRVRGVLGATFVEKADPSSLRGKYGVVGGVNVAHASDELDNARIEIALWKQEAKLDLELDGRAQIAAYIKQWRETPVLATQKIRTLCHEYAQEFFNREQYQNAITEVLLDECPDWSNQEVQRLADAILGNMDLDREKR